ncbi:MAG: polysaccharide deacetylase family protein [Anaerolineales bacterium]
MTNRAIKILFLIALLAACTSNHSFTTLLPSPSPSTPSIITSTTLPKPTLTPTGTFTPLPSPTIAPIPTETWIVQGPGDVTVPILLYHHIADSTISNRYYISPQKFEAQMKLLHDWGYASITTEMLIRAITAGEKLPPHPFLLTLDDGNLDNYLNAFPIAQKYGFKGVLYLVVNYIGTENYMNVAQILEMYNAGWEVGSHGVNHKEGGIYFTFSVCKSVAKRIPMLSSASYPGMAILPFSPLPSLLPHRTVIDAHQNGRPHPLHPHRRGHRPHDRTAARN